MNMEKIWKKFLTEIIENGHKHTKDDTLIHEIIGVHEFIPAPVAHGLTNMMNPEMYLDLIKKGYYDIPGGKIEVHWLQKKVTGMN